MKSPLSDAVIQAVRKVTDSSIGNGEILDVHAAAEEIRRHFPEENLPFGELVALMLNAGVPAMEISQSGLMLEIILPAEAEDEAHEARVN